MKNVLLKKEKRKSFQGLKGLILEQKNEIDRLYRQIDILTKRVNIMYQHLCDDGK